MSRVLEAAQGEVAELELELTEQRTVHETAAARIGSIEGELAVLAEIQELAARLNGTTDAQLVEPVVPVPPAATRRSASSQASPSGRSAGTSATAEEAVAAVRSLLERGEATQAELAEATGFKINRVVTALEKIAERTGDKRGGGRGSPVWRLKTSAPAANGKGELSGRTRRSLEREGGGTAAVVPPDVEAALRDQVVDTLEREGAKQSDDLYEMLEKPDAVLLARVMGSLREAGTIRKIARAGHVYWERCS